MRSKRQSNHPIQVAARRSGLSADVIRAWERRYDAVHPERTETNRRFYSDDDVERLSLLREVTRAGRRICEVARLSSADLKALVVEDRVAAAKVVPFHTGSQTAESARRYLRNCLVAIDRLDSAALDLELSNASVDLSVPLLLDQLVTPLMTETGQRWKDGRYRIAHEHLATATVRSFMSRLNTLGRHTAGAPEIVVAAPAGTKHGIGALAVSVAAGGDGWNVTNLGADVPVEEIAAATKLREARAVALSIVYPMDDPAIGPDLKRLGGWLGKDVVLFVGGASAPAYSDVLDEIGARVIEDVSTLREELQGLRTAQAGT